MTGAIKGSPTEKLYQELEIEYLRSRRWFRKLCLFYKIILYNNSVMTLQDSVDPLCSCGNDIESIVHLLLHFANFATQRQTALNKLKSINASILAESENSVV